MPVSFRLYWALIVASVAIPALLFAAAVVKNHHDVTRDARDSIHRTVNVMHEHGRKVFETEELAIARVDDHIRGMSWKDIDDPAVSEFLVRLKEPLEQAVSIWVTDRWGRVRAGSQSWDRSVTIDGREFFTAQKNADAGFHVSAGFRGRATMVDSFAVSRRRFSPTGVFDGTIHISLSPDYFARFFAQAAPDFAEHSALLLRADGEVLAREPADPTHAKVPADTDLMRAIAAQPNEGMLVARSARDGLERLIGYRRVQGYPVYVVLGASTGAILAEWYRNIAAFAAVALAAAVTLVLMAALALRDAREKRRVTDRLQAAFEAMGREVERREAAEQRLRDSQRMEALGQLAGGIAHDFNNVLQGVIGGARLIGRRADDPAAVTRLTGMLIAAAERGTAITGRLTTLTRRGSLRSEPIPVAALLAGMQEVLEHTLGRHVSVSAAAEQDGLVLQGDRSQLETVLVNLAVNARDAMAPGGGHIALAASAERVGASPVHPAGLQPGHYVRLSVTDDGAGMDEATLARAVDPFFTTKARGEGSGLGLAMASSFANQSGGSLHLASRPGEGTVVTLWLPQAEAGAHGLARTGPAAGAEPARTRSCVLAVVDDEDFVREGMMAELADLGHGVNGFSGGAELLAWLEGGNRPDLLVTDLAMPGMNGLALIQAARQRLPGLPALLVTGHQEDASDSTLHAVRQGGPFALLLKPVLRNELAEGVAALLPQARDGVGSQAAE